MEDQNSISEELYAKKIHKISMRFECNSVKTDHYTYYFIELRSLFGHFLQMRNIQTGDITIIAEEDVLKTKAEVGIGWLEFKIFFLEEDLPLAKVKLKFFIEKSFNEIIPRLTKLFNNNTHLLDFTI